MSKKAIKRPKAYLSSLRIGEYFKFSNNDTLLSWYRFRGYFVGSSSPVLSFSYYSYTDSHDRNLYCIEDKEVKRYVRSES